MPPQKRRWGGPRKGAGRPPVHQKPMRTIAIKLTDEQIAYLDGFGAGNRSKAIRKLIDNAIWNQP